MAGDFIRVPPPQAIFEPINWHPTALHELGHYAEVRIMPRRSEIARDGARAPALHVVKRRGTLTPDRRAILTPPLRASSAAQGRSCGATEGLSSGSRLDADRGQCVAPIRKLGANSAKSLILLVPQEGFEPPTHALRMTPEHVATRCGALRK